MKVRNRDIWALAGTHMLIIPPHDGEQLMMMLTIILSEQDIQLQPIMLFVVHLHVP